MGATCQPGDGPRLRTATMPSESSYWIVSAPVQEEKSTEQMYKDLSQRLVSDSAAERSDVAPLTFPQLKTGTLESLIALSEELPKTDAFFASVVTRIVDTLRALFNDDDQALNEHLVLDGESVEDYLMHWQWNAGKYRADRALPELVEKLNKVGRGAHTGNAIDRQRDEAKAQHIQPRQGPAPAARAQEAVRVSAHPAATYLCALWRTSCGRTTSSTPTRTFW